MLRRTAFVMLCLLLTVPLASVSAQELSDAALEATISRANQLTPNLGRPSRWEFEILLPSTDSAVMCPLTPGYKTDTTRQPFIVTLFYDTASGEPETYDFHVAGDGSVIQPCDPAFTGEIGMSAYSPALPQAADACTVTPSNGEFANVRLQPDVDAEQLGAITGQQLVLGRNEETTWYLTQTGWVAGTVVNTAGDCNPNILPARDASIMTLGISTTPPLAATPGEGTPVAAAPSDFICPPDFNGYLPPRIQRGAVTAQVGVGGVPNTIRSLPTTESERLGQIQPNRRLDFVWNGPRCSGGYVWWEIEIDGVRGWTAESSFEQGEYYLEPTTGNAAPVEAAPTPAPEVAEAPAAAQPITPQNLASVRSVGSIGNVSAFAWGADENFIVAFASRGELSVSTIGALFVDVGDGILIDTTTEITASAYTPDNAQFAIGETNGNVALYADANTRLAAIPAHTAPVNVIAFSPDGAVMATGGGANDSSADSWTLRLWDVAGVAARADDDALLRAVRFPYPVRDVAFSADGGTVAVVAGTDTDAALWVYGNGGLGDNTLTVVLDDTQGYPFVTAVPDTLAGDFVYAQGSALYSLTIATGMERQLYEQANLLITGAAFWDGQMFVTNTSAQSPRTPTDSVPLYVYDYAALTDGGAAARVLDSVAADRIAFADGGIAFAVRTITGEMRFYQALE